MINQKDVISMIYDYLSLLFSNVKPSLIRTVILFGSVARNEFDKQSDIDLFIDTLFPIETSVEQSLRIFEGLQKHRWNIKGINLPLKILSGNLESQQWSELRAEIQDHGVVLYGTYTKNAVKDYCLINYESTKLKQSQRMKLARTLYGYTIRKEGKMYIQQGLIQKEHGLRIGTNVFITPVISKKRVESVLKLYKIRYQIRKIGF